MYYMFWVMYCTFYCYFCFGQVSLKKVLHFNGILVKQWLKYILKKLIKLKAALNGPSEPNAPDNEECLCIMFLLTEDFAHTRMQSELHHDCFRVY